MWIQLESVKHDWRWLKAFLCLPLTVGSVGVMVMTPDCESIGCEFKYSTGIFGFVEMIVLVAGSVCTQYIPQCDTCWPICKQHDQHDQHGLAFAFKHGLKHEACCCFIACEKKIS